MNATLRQQRIARFRAEEDQILNRQRDERLRRFSDGSKPKQNWIQTPRGWEVTPI